MILVGNQRGGARDLALHLMKTENEIVEVGDLRGFVASDLLGAFKESYAVSRATYCKQHLFSLSLNPPKNAIVSNAEFEAAIDRAEERLGLKGQPRAIVFHEKRDDDGELRRHAHAVWCRIDTRRMKAVQLSFTHSKLQWLARELYLDHGWQMPSGLLRAGYCDPRSFTLDEWQQAKRRGKNPKLLKALFQDAWTISDERRSFANALLERGFVLARGDRRGFVAVDHMGEVYSLSRWCGIKPKGITARLGAPDDLPSVIDAHRAAVNLVTARLRSLCNTEQSKLAEICAQADGDRSDFILETSARLKETRSRQDQRRAALIAIQESRFRTGLFGLLDRLTGRRKRIADDNLIERRRLEEDQARERAALSAEIQHKRIEATQQLEISSAKHARRAEGLQTDIESLRALFLQRSNRTNGIAGSDPRQSTRRRARDGPAR